MNKKFLLVLPLITLVAGCGVKKTNIYELPKGGRDVNINDEDDIMNFHDLINEALVKSTDALLNKAKLNIMLEHITGHYHDVCDSYSDRDKAFADETYGNISKSSGTFLEKESFNIDVDDLSLDIGINAWGLGGNIGDINAQVDLSADGAISYAQTDFRQDSINEEPDRDDNFAAEASCDNGKLTAWLQDGTILLDATDKKFLEFAAPIAGTIADQSNPYAFNGLVNLLAGKWSISGLIPDDVLENPINDSIPQLSTMLGEIDPASYFCGLLNPELFPDAPTSEVADIFTDIFTCKVYEDNSIGVQATITGDWAEENFEDDVVYDEDYHEENNSWNSVDEIGFRKGGFTDGTWVTVTILFNKDLYLSSIGIQFGGGYDFHSAFKRLHNDDTYKIYEHTLDVAVEGSIGLTFDFNPEEVKLPNISNFDELDLNNLPF